MMARHDENADHHVIWMEEGMTFDPKTQLLEGAKILSPRMLASGFTFAPEEAGPASGGAFARGSYTKGDRRLELHYRWGLGIVRYHIAEHALDHDVYMRLLGVYPQSQWVRVKMDKTIDGFRRLLFDLEHFCHDFLQGPGEHFVELADKFAQDPEMFSGLKGLGR